MSVEQETYESLHLQDTKNSVKYENVAKNGSNIIAYSDFKSLSTKPPLISTEESVEQVIYENLQDSNTETNTTDSNNDYKIDYRKEEIVLPRQPEPEVVLPKQLLEPEVVLPRQPEKNEYEQKGSSRSLLAFGICSVLAILISIAAIAIAATVFTLNKLEEKEVDMDNQNVTQEIQEMMEMIADLRVEVTSLKMNVSRIETELEAVDEMVLNNNETLQAVVNETFRQRVMFSAYTGGTSGSSSTTVPFSRTDVNIGGHFDTSTYEFTCPYSGYYFFMMSFSFGPLYGSTYGTSIVYLQTDNGVPGNSNNIMRIYSLHYGSSSDNHYQQSSNSIIVLCQAEQKFWAYESGYTVISGGRLSDSRNTFNGMFLYSSL